MLYSGHHSSMSYMGPLRKEGCTSVFVEHENAKKCTVCACVHMLYGVVWVNSSPTAGQGGEGCFTPQGILCTNITNLQHARGEAGVLNNARWVMICVYIGT